MAESFGLPAWFKVSRKRSPGPEVHFILDAGVEVAGKILNVSGVGIHVHVPVRFDDGAVLTFRVHDCTAKGNVLYCRPDGEQFYMGLSTGVERRSEPRLSAYELVTVRVISSDKSGRVLSGRLLDVSHSGIGLSLGFPLSVGVLVEVRADSGSVLYGEVRNCAKAPGGGYRIGIFAEESFFGDLRAKHLSSIWSIVMSFSGRVRRALLLRFRTH
jgi:hypothetical protein